MSSISTLIFRRSERVHDNKALYQKSHFHMGFISWCLWTFAAIIAAATAETSANVTGVSVSFRVQDVLLMLFATCMLVRGLSGGNPYLVYPWVAISSWNIYYCQYPSLIRMLTKLKQAKHVSILACMVFGIDVIGMVTKTLLIFRVVQLSVNLWYQRKLQCETLEKM